MIWLLKTKNVILMDMEKYQPSPEWSSDNDSNDSDSSSRKSRKKKIRKGPKRAMSAYLFFCKDKRAGIKSDNPNMTSKEVTSELARVWREEVKDDESASKKYVELANKDKTRYNTEKSNWTDAEESSVEEEKAVPKVKTGKSKWCSQSVWIC